ncbi:NlpC/P60 family protein [Seinonella peptonophila]|uniref:NlpC/P60 family protein n=1 Tax=Seinonella peptonophila TaxID=112248 RepID=A0A1M4TZM9_9BACL|nr:C40 family peptidase [Seinonella peptonophila]SHE49909.1 NlpC/P60 family protein [Seinonella peptonophila]
MRKFKITVLLLALFLALPTTVFGAVMNDASYNIAGNNEKMNSHDDQKRDKIKSMIKTLKKLVKNNGTNNLPRIVYQIGGNRPPNSNYVGHLDGASFTQWIYKKYFGIKLPRTVYDQYKLMIKEKKAVKVTKENLKPGDLVFHENTYNCGVCKDDNITHVGIYIGDNKFVYNSSSKGGIVINDLREPYFTSHYYDAIRINGVGSK